MDAKKRILISRTNLGHISKSPDDIDIVKFVLIDKSDTKWLLFPLKYFKTGHYTFVFCVGGSLTDNN